MTKDVKPVQSTTYNLQATYNPIYFEKGTDITVSDEAGVFGAAGTSWTVTNAGTIAGANFLNNADVGLASNSSFTNEAGGVVTASGSEVSTVWLGAGGAVTNNGSIGVSGNEIAGVNFAAAGTIDNTGSITASGVDGNAIFGAASKITNTGSISASGANMSGIFATAAVTATNSGSITSKNAAGQSGGAGVNLNDGGSFTNLKGGTVYSRGHYVSSVYLKNGATAENYGSISVVATGSGFDNGVDLQSGDDVFHNEASGTITGSGPDVAGVGLQAGGSVFNYGAITVSGSGDNGVYFRNGGSLTNAGKISEKVGAGGVWASNGANVVNKKGGVISGGVAGVFSATAYFLPSGSGLTLNNNAGASIKGETGVFANGKGDSIVNAGSIVGTTVYTFSNSKNTAHFGDGVFLGQSSASLTNDTGGTISGARDGVYAAGENATVTNAGSITGADGSIRFLGDGANTLTLQTGSTLTGVAIGSTSGDATNALVLQGVGTANNNFDNFDTLDVQSASGWTLGGSSSIGATLVDEAILTVTGSLTSVFTLENGGVLDYAGAFNQKVRFAGANAGTLQVNGDTAGTVTGFGENDVIDFETVAYASGDAISVVASADDDTIEVLNASHQEIASFLSPLGYTTSDFSLQSIDGGAGLSVTGEETVVTVAQFLAEQSMLDANPNGFIVADTAADVTPALSKLAADTHAIGITLTDFALPILTLSPTEIASDRAALNKISKPFGIAVVDATANDSLDMKTLNAPGQVVSVTLSDGGKVVNEAGLSIAATAGEIQAGTAAISVSGGSGTVTNSGALSGFYGVLLKGGGSVTNQSSGTITATGPAGPGRWPPAEGIATYGAASTVNNSGKILAAGYDAFGVNLAFGGTLTNSGSIKANGALSIGVSAFSDASATNVVNSGLIADYGEASCSIGLAHKGGSITNNATGKIIATIVLDGGERIVNNYGIILAEGAQSGGPGIMLVHRYSDSTNGGKVTNHAKAQIEGYSGIVGVHTSANVYNSGSIQGTHVATFYDSFDKWNGAWGDGVGLFAGGAVTNNAGGTISGARYGVYVTSGAGTVTNAGSITGADGSIKFSGGGANKLTLETGSLLTGAVVGSTASGAKNALVLEGSGTASNAFEKFQTLSVGSGASWKLSGTSSFGSASISGGALTISGAVTSAFTIANDGVLTFAVSRAEAGTFSLAAGSKLIINSGDTLSLSGATSLSGSVSGAGTLALTGGTTTLSAVVANYATATQKGGSITVGDKVATDKAELINETAGTWDIKDNSGIAVGADAASFIANAGLLEKTGGTGTSTVTPAITDTGEIVAASGTLDLKAAVLGTGTDAISGASTLEFDAGVAAAQTVDFTGAGGELLLDAPLSFHGEINGFDTAGAGASDAIALLGAWSVGSFTGTDTGGTLALSSVSSHLSLNFLGNYESGTFTGKTGSGGTTLITFT